MPAAQRAGLCAPCSSSTFMTSLSNIGKWVVTKKCGKLFSSAIRQMPEHQTQCLPDTVLRPRLANTAGAQKETIGIVRFDTLSEHMMAIISPRSFTGFVLKKGQQLKVTDPKGEQVADLVAFNAGDTGEVISSGRSLAYASKLFLTFC